MAMALRFTCQHCLNSLMSWDEGKPYYFDQTGKKEYAYHPDPRRALCVGVESPHLCLSCGEIVDVDSMAPVTHCSACGSQALVSTFHLDGQNCPKCRQGVFRQEPGLQAIS